MFGTGFVVGLARCSLSPGLMNRDEPWLRLHVPSYALFFCPEDGPTLRY